MFNYWLGSVKLIELFAKFEQVNIYQLVLLLWSWLELLNQAFQTGPNFNLGGWVVGKFDNDATTPAQTTDLSHRSECGKIETWNFYYKNYLHINNLTFLLQELK